MSCARFTITPLGAAIVEAMPDREKMRRVRRRFKHNNECPTSLVFPTKDAVERFYRERGKKMTAIES